MTIDISRLSKAAVQNTHKLPTDTHTSEAVNKTVNKIEKNVDGPTQMSRPRVFHYAEERRPVVLSFRVFPDHRPL